MAPCEIKDLRFILRSSNRFVKVFLNMYVIVPHTRSPRSLVRLIKAYYGVLPKCYRKAEKLLGATSA